MALHIVMESQASFTAELRRFIMQAFGPEDLTVLCYDYFRDVGENFTTGMSKGQRVQMLIEHCEQRGLTQGLLLALDTERPGQLPHGLKARLRTAPPPQPQGPRQRNARQVFISHAYEDSDLAHRIAHDLTRQGWRTWIAPESILPGEKWAAAIERGLDESGVFVLLLTPAAVQSNWVRTETSVAIELQHEDMMRFLPLDVQPCVLPALWRAYQRVNFRGAHDVGMTSLLAALDSKRVDAAMPQPAPDLSPTPRGITSFDEKLALDAKQRGDALMVLRDYSTAIVAYDLAIKHDPNVAECFWARAECRDYLGEYDAAITDYTQAIFLDPSVGKYYKDRGVSYSRKRAYEDTIADQNRAIALEPNTAEFYCSRSWSYFGKQDYDRAIADATRAIDLEPNNAEFYSLRGTHHHNKGVNSHNESDYDRAIADQTRAIELEPNNAEFYNLRGSSLCQKGDYNRGIADISRAIDLEPRHAEFYHSRGSSYFKKKDYHLAVTDDTHVIDLKSNDARYYYSRGKSYARLHKWNLAKLDWQKAASLGHVRAKEELAKLK